MEKDLTQGTPWKVLFNFSVPMLISVVFQQVYNIADSMIAGHFIGEDALAAVGASYPITMLFLAVAFGCNIGCSVVISQLFGAKRYAEMKTAMNTSYIFALGLGGVLTVFGLFFCNNLMQMVQTPANIFSDSSLYLQIYIAGLLFMFLYNICTGMYNALGDSKTPLYLLIGSSIFNIIMDIVLVTVFSMGVAGVAWATFMAQGLASVLAFIVLSKRMKRFDTERRSKLFSFSMFKRILVIAVPSILQQSFISVGNMFVQGIINSYGSATIAGYSAAIKLNTFAIMLINTLSNGLSTYVAQNIGAQRLNRVRQGFKASIILVMIVAVPFVLLYFFFGEQALGIFMNTSVSLEALDVGLGFLKIVSPFYLVVSIKLIIDAILRGAGAMKAFLAATFIDLILRVVLAFVFSAQLGVTGIWVSWPVGWAAGTIFSVCVYFSGIWKPKYLKKAA